MSELPMKVIEKEAERLIESDPLISAHGDFVTIDGLVQELGVLEETAEDQYELGNITGDTRLGILLAVAGLRRSIIQARE